MGEARPCSAALRAMTPLRTSHSSGLPCSRPVRIEVVRSSGTPVNRPMISSITPSCQATDHATPPRGVRLRLGREPHGAGHHGPRGAVPADALDLLDAVLHHARQGVRIAQPVQPGGRRLVLGVLHREDHPVVRPQLDRVSCRATTDDHSVAGGMQECCNGRADGTWADNCD